VPKMIIKSFHYFYFYKNLKLIRKDSNGGIFGGKNKN